MILVLMGAVGFVVLIAARIWESAVNFRTRRQKEIASGEPGRKRLRVFGNFSRNLVLALLGGLPACFSLSRCPDQRGVWPANIPASAEMGGRAVLIYPALALRLTLVRPPPSGAPRKPR